MPPVTVSLLRHPAAVGLRVLVWPALIELLCLMAARREDDALAAGFTAFFVMVVLGFGLALADGLVLQTRVLVPVWIVVTLVVGVLVSLQPLVDAVIDGDGRDRWGELFRAAVPDLPSSLVFFTLLVGVPAALGAFTGAVVRRSRLPHGQDRVRAA